MTHYFDVKQDSKPCERILRISMHDSLTFITSSGVFSPRRIDPGSRLLVLNTPPPKTKEKVLDLGCGYGFIGISLAKLYPKSSFFLTDSNSRAVSLAKRNAKLNGTSNVRVYSGHLFHSLPRDFDMILLNPPQAAGKRICFSMIEGAKSHLHDGGRFLLVARRNKGGASLAQRMRQVFGDVRTLAKKGGYWVYVSS
jgi:16S rRNA (guanine1207-N2)-methyltransferase